MGTELTRELWELACERAGEPTEPYPPELQDKRFRIILGPKLVGMVGQSPEDLEPLVIPGLTIEEIS